MGFDADVAAELLTDSELSSASSTFSPLTLADIVGVCALSGPEFTADHDRFGTDVSRRALWSLVPRGCVSVDGGYGATLDALGDALAWRAFDGASIAASFGSAAERRDATIAALQACSDGAVSTLMSRAAGFGASRFYARQDWAGRWAADDSLADFDTFARPLVLWMASHVELMASSRAAIAAAMVADEAALIIAAADASAAAATAASASTAAAAALALDPENATLIAAAAAAVAASNAAAFVAADAEAATNPFPKAVRRAVFSLVGCSAP